MIIYLIVKIYLWHKYSHHPTILSKYELKFRKAVCWRKQCGTNMCSVPILWKHNIFIIFLLFIIYEWKNIMNIYWVLNFMPAPILSS